MSKLLIGIPSLDYVNIEFVKCLVNLIIRLKAENVDFDVHIESGTLVYMARDKIARRAVNEGYSAVLWLDADMIFTDTVLEDLQFSGKDFVTGVYHARRPGYSSCVFSDINLSHLNRIEPDKYPNNTFEIAGCGFGCVLISTEIFKQVLYKYETCFTPMLNIGEDLAFCQRCIDLGIKMYCEPSVVCGHISHKTIYPEDREAWKKEIESCFPM